MAVLFEDNSSVLFLSGERARQSGTGTGTGPESSSLPNDRVTLVTIWTYLERRRLVLLEEEVLVGLGTWMIRRRPVGGRTEGRKGRSEQCVSSVQPSSEYPAPTSEDSRERDREREKTRAVCPGFGTRALTPTQAKA